MFGEISGKDACCSISPYYYLMVVIGVFAIMIRNKKGICEIKYGETEFKLALYTDNVWSLSEPEVSMKELIDVWEIMGGHLVIR